MRRLVTASAIVFLAACSREKQTVAPARAVTTAPEKAVAISPQVQALLKPDPDLDRKLSPEEVRATLAAAQTQPPPNRVAPPSAPTGESDWKKAENDVDAKRAAYEARLRSITVYLGPDGMYHNGNCSSLFVRQYDRNGFLMRLDFVGQAWTLLHARDAHLTAHGQCGAPSYAFSYAQQ